MCFFNFTVNSSLQTRSRSYYSEAEQDANWENLSPQQRSYFNHLAAGDPERTGQAFFEDTVPVELQDEPEKLEVFLNGGTYKGVDYPDRDWSHDTSRVNGGSDSADNGRWEDASVNRSRGSANSTLTEQAAADASTEADVALLENSSVASDAQTSANLTLAAEGVEATSALATAGELALDFLAPVVGGCAAAKLASDQFQQVEHKVAAGATAGVAAAALLCTPVGQLGLGCYLGYKLVRGGYSFFCK